MAKLPSSRPKVTASSSPRKPTAPPKRSPASRPAASEPLDELDEDVDDGDSLLEDEGEFTVVDDPVRMYLMQMGEIPMLNRREEVDAARGIERWRRRFRKSGFRVCRWSSTATFPRPPGSAHLPRWSWPQASQ